ncbi:MAG TPA: sensor histidine kinase [Novosphingobium sp.]|nr:sensor histidine kinase [Novosphingobium sp.]
MRGLAQFDISRGLRTPAARVGAQVAFGVACGLLMIVARWLLDLWAPSAGPFVLVYPTVLLATLYGHWRAGAVAYVISFLWAWLIVLPSSETFILGLSTLRERVVINAIGAGVVLLFAETFRAAVERATNEREREIERRSMLFKEMEHRTKNNFAMVASLLEIQKKRETAPEVRAAFDDAIGRVRSFADAYSHLATEQGEGAHVDMRPFLESLIGRVVRGAFTDRVEVHRDIADMTLPREIAVAIGLFVNEALINCAKYAFPDDRRGTVRVFLERDGAQNWSLGIIDDGVGSGGAVGAAAGGREVSGLGASLFDAFARQARGSHSVVISSSGCQVALRGGDGGD